ncbi:Prosaposin [Clonorchis sinensis]|uniref:Prosaposin n=1 Tax=Clonorchis sinensis TaxID=79923 RepID=A0A8T1MT04_CLOSI|nr:Prosaposin [Clonorchis sinensis]
MKLAACTVFLLIASTMAVPYETELPNQPTEACLVCMGVLTFIKSRLEDRELREYLVNIAEQICHLLPSKITEECGEIVQEHMDLALKSFGDLIQPRSACQVLQFCDYLKLKVQRIPLERGLVCKLCQKTLRVVKSIITSESFLNLIRDQFYLVCDPKLLVHDLCTQLMESFLEDIVIHINSIEPMKMCQKCHMCSQ